MSVFISTRKYFRVKKITNTDATGWH